MTMTVTAGVTVDVGPLERLSVSLIPGVNAVIAEFAEKIASRARELAPVRTGADRDSIEAVLTDMAATISIGNGLSPIYGVYLELGYHHHGSGTWVQRPALIPAYLEFRDAFVAAIAALVRA